MALDNFKRALIGLGASDVERAKKLHIPLRTFKDYKAGRLPLAFSRFMHPDLLRALADDAERQPLDTITHNDSEVNYSIP